MDRLWNSDDLVRWNKAYGELPKRLEASEKEGLTELHRWLTEDLSERLRSKTADSITSEDYVKIVEWKLKRSTWRPKLLAMAKAVPDDAIQEASKAAFQSLTAIQNTAEGPISEEIFRKACGTALDHLTTIKGLGPATASAILSAASSQVPYFSDEATAVSGGKAGSYTKAEFSKMALKLRSKAEELNKSDPSAGATWNAKKVEAALHSEFLSLKEGTKSAKKRKRDNKS